MKYGYARVSTDDQNPALQIAALKKAKCAHIFQDRLTGATTNRPALTKCLKTLRPGDTLIVWKLDRLGRSLRDLITMLDDLRDRGIAFHSLTEAIDTGTPTGRAMWQMIGILAELERSLIVERTRAGMKAARARGIRPGPRRNSGRSRSSTPRSYAPRAKARMLSPVFSASAARRCTGRLPGRTHFPSLPVRGQETRKDVNHGRRFPAPLITRPPPIMPALSRDREHGRGEGTLAAAACCQ